MWDFFNPVISGLEAQEEISTWFDGSFPSKELAVGGGGEIGYGFRCWVACFLRQWRLEKGSGDTCASQLRSQHVRRALAFGAVASCFLGLLLGRFKIFVFVEIRFWASLGL
ncbi:hypothetical protein DY000_02038081 [Brassica cretica]|uniref:Uncharacterized protein n=1 Tax=Brassica cretica TaxID=69181 RepID=A0ABQ7BCV5_BRACR|nr:hypothetical protein DY000_02038081 [Brassica cretica]